VVAYWLSGGLAALLVEWAITSRMFAGDLERRAAPGAEAGEPLDLPIFALCVLGATLIGFGASSALSIAPVWIAAAGATALALHQRPVPKDLVVAAEPAFLVFVLGLGVVARAAGDHGLSSAVHSLIPHSGDLAAMLAIAAMSAVLANLVNNLPAMLIILPVAALLGPAPVLAMLIGVNIGPNLTYVGSLATLLWRRVLHAHDATTDAGEFTRLGALTVPAALVTSTVALWLALRV